MNNKILVTYASRFGSTKGVAEAIGKKLVERGAQVDVLPMKEVTDLTSYTAVVAGSAINAGAWLPEAMQFLKNQGEALTKKPFAAFLVCMTLTMHHADQYLSHVATWLDPVSREVNPVSCGYFAGGLDIKKIPSFRERLKFRVSVMLGVWKEGDHRDWQAIQRWAESLPPLLMKE